MDTAGTRQPIAIIGLGMRLPGGIRTLEELAARLFAGDDLITRVPEERFTTAPFEFPNVRGHATTFSAGVIEQIFDFDYRYFALPKLEAQSMDPQQRLCLEMACDAIAMANLPQSALAGTPTGVFIGSSAPDMAMSHADDVASITPYGMVGTNLAIISNRLSYCLDLRGPSMTIDTACSSSLTALCQAVSYLRDYPERMCLAGGVNILLSPIPFIGFSQAHMLAADGRCRVFDRDASGYVRSEGGAVLLLKTLSQARSDGDPILAVIEAVHLNQDGRTPGISLPSSAAQEQLLRELYDGCDLSRLAYVEAHGTGTRAGDPLEAASLGHVLGQRLLREQQRALYIGSVKSNLGHLETASGMAGLLKAVVVLQRAAIPPTINITALNPAIPFAELGLQVVRETTPLPVTSAAPLIGINSFGFGGANAHAIISADPLPARPPVPRHSTLGQAPGVLLEGLSAGRVLHLSAASPSSLAALAGACLELLDASNFQALVANYAFCRDALDYALFMPAPDAATLRAALERCSHSEVCREELVSAPHRGRGSLVFSGNGSQFTGMGRALLEMDGNFACILERIDQALHEFQSWSVLDYLRQDDALWQLHETEKIQVLIFAIQTALAELLRLHGVEAHSACGHSVGEVAAAYYCGLLSLRDACRVIVYRSRHQAAAYASGDMAVVRMERSQLDGLLHAFPDVEIASTNTASSFTLSGSQPDLQALVSAARRHYAAAAKLLHLKYPFHNRRMEPIREQLLHDLAAVEPQPAQRTFYSCITEPITRGQTLPADYWWHNIRNEVRFADSIRRQIADDHDLFVEIGPRTILLNYIREIAREQQRSLLTLSLTARVAAPADLRHGLRQLMATRLFVHPEYIAERSAVQRTLQLPPYPFDREPCAVPRSREHLAYFRQEGHPLLGRRLAQAYCTFCAELDAARWPWLSGHEVQGRCLFPMAGFMAMALAIARLADPERAHVAVEDLQVLSPLEVSDAHITLIRTALDEQRQLTIGTRRHLSNEDFVPQVRALIGARTAMPPCARNALQEVRLHGHSLSSEEFYAQAQEHGITYRGAFQSIRSMRRCGRLLLLRLSNHTVTEDLISVFAIDGALQALFALADGALAGPLQLPSAAEAVILSCAPALAPPELNALVMLRQAAPTGSVLDIYILDSYDQPLLVLQGVRYLRYHSGEQQLQGFFIQGLRPGTCHFGIGEVDFAQHLAQTLQRSSALIPRTPPELHSYYTALISVYILQAVRIRAQAAGADELFGIIASDERAEARSRYLLEILTANALAVRHADGRYTVDNSNDIDPDKIFNTIITLYPESFVRAELIARLGSHIGALLAGHLSFEQCVGAGQDNIFEHYCCQTPGSILISRLCASFIAAAVAERGEHSAVQVLLLGGANRPLFTALEPFLASQALSVVIYSPREDLQLRSRCAAYANVHLTPALAALAQQHLSFDIVIAADPLHLGPQLQEQRDEVLQLVRPGGYVIISECCANFVDSFINSFRDYELPSPPESRARPGTQAGGRDASLLADRPEYMLADASAFEDWHFYIYRRTPQPAWQPDCSAAFAKPSAFIDLGQTLGAGTAALLHDLLHTHDRQQLLCDVDASSLPARLQTDPENPWPYAQTIVALCGLTQSQPATAQLSRLGQGLAQLLTMLAKVSSGSLTVILDDAAAVLDRTAAPPSWPAQLAYALLALVRTLRNETGAQLRVITLNLADHSAHQALLAELTIASADNEVCLQGRQRLLPTFMKADEGEMLPAPLPPADPDDRRGQLSYTRLECLRPGNLSSLTFMADHLDAPGDDEVIVSVSATGLNYRDVMWALGLLPAEALERGFSGPHLGLECTGTVLRAGSAVRHVRVGQAVIAFGRACFASCMRCPGYAVFALPEKLSLAQGAALPVAFLTAYYAITHLARAAPAERILIHGGAGGVGFAAIEIAQQLQLEIYATAGTQHKRALLQRLGVEHVYDSRSLDFADQIRADSGGRGVDIVLNSLYREGALTSLRLLAPFGRFIELGKRDIFENNALHLKLFKDNITFCGVDIDELLIYRQELAARLFAEILRHFEQGHYYPLPLSIFTRRQCQEAFAAMKSSAHIGKIVVTMSDPDPQLPAAPAWRLPAALPACSPAPEAVLISGGLGGLGAALAQDLLQGGCALLLLAGRRAADTPSAATVLSTLRRLSEERGQGQQVIYLTADVTDPGQCSTLLDGVQRELTGRNLRLSLFVHAAAALRDALAADLSCDDFALAIGAKYAGARNILLGLQQRALIPECSLLFSSVTTVFGNEAQANYVFANALLEGLARACQAPLHCCALLPGPVADAGMLAGRQRLLDIFEHKLGLTPLRAQDLSHAALRCARLGRTLAFCSLNLRAISGLRGLEESRFSLLRARCQITARPGDQSLLERLLSAEPSQAIELLSARLQTLFALQLGSAPEQINVNQQLSELGVDSLSLMEIVTTLEGELQIRSPAGQISGNSTIAQIARSCINTLRGNCDTEEEIVTSLERQHGVSLSPAFRSQLRADRQEG